MTREKSEELTRRQILATLAISGAVLLGSTSHGPGNETRPNHGCTNRFRSNKGGFEAEKRRGNDNPSQSENEPQRKNVSDFGANGNGKDDDTLAIRRAFNAATDGDTVYFPEGDYLVSRDDRHSDQSIINVPTDITNLTIRGQKGYGSVKIVAARKEYDSRVNFGIFKIPVDDNVIDGLAIRDLSLDGNRPKSGMTDGISTFGFHLYPSGAGGGHDILIEDCYLENFNGAAITTREGGESMVFNRITSVNNKQNFGMSEEDDSTAGTDEYGIVVKNSVSKNADLVGFDHNRGGRVKIDGFYSENNTNSGLKSTGDNRRTHVQNATFKNENYFAAMRTNKGRSSEKPESPLEISLDTVAMRNCIGSGVYVSGNNTAFQNSKISGGPIEVRGCTGSLSDNPSNGGVTILSSAGGEIDELRVVDTQSGPGLFYTGDYDLSIEEYYHAENEGDAVGSWNPRGKLTINTQINDDPGLLDTPQESEVGAWSKGPRRVD